MKHNGSLPSNPGTYPGIASDATMTRSTHSPMLAATATGEPLSLLRLREVTRRTALSRSAVYRAIAAGTFPAPVKLGERASAWPEHEISAWCVARIAERDGRAA